MSESTELPITQQPGYLFAAESDADPPHNVSKDGIFVDVWSADWISLGMTDPRYCSTDDRNWQLALNWISGRHHAGSLVQTRALLGWESDNSKWRILAPVRAPEWGGTPSTRKLIAVPAWPIYAVLEGPPRVYHASA